jgi:2',3'-cyclic-nucleotide 2'-phosphodiesterase (5'-nucleotidase family)
MKSKDAPNLAANLRSERGESNFLPNQESSHIYEFDGGIRIGIIGLATVETPITTSGFTSHLFPDYKFLNYTDIVIKESKELRRKGVHAVLILSHVGNGCNPGFKYGIWKKDT